MSHRSNLPQEAGHIYYRKFQGSAYIVGTLGGQWEVEREKWFWEGGWYQFFMCQDQVLDYTALKIGPLKGLLLKASAMAHFSFLV